MKESKKATNQGTHIAPETPVAPAVPVMSVDAYIKHFSGLLEVAYSKLKPAYLEVHKDPINTNLDDLYALFYACQVAKEQDASIETIRAQQADAQDFCFDYINIRHVLSDCLKITLNSLNPASVLTPEALSHGAVQGMLTFTDKIKSSLKHRVLALDYERLAQELHHEIHAYTKGFALALPLPEVIFSDKPAEIKPVDISVVLATTKPGPFDLTPAIGGILSTLDADAIYTDIMVMPDEFNPDPTLLVPVTDQTIKNIAEMIAGYGSTPYLYNGDLLVQSGKKYTKIVPNIRQDGYADYVFTAYNYKSLTGRIYQLQQLLKTSSEYRVTHSAEDDFKYQPLPNDPSARKAAIDATLMEAKVLLDMANQLFPPDFYEDEAACIRNIIKAQYYYPHPLYISAHRLAAWVYYPVEYTAFIGSKPMDAEGKRLYYEPDHLDKNPLNNRAENLEIKLKQANLDNRSTIIRVQYNNTLYPHLKKYCADTGAGNYKNLQQKIDIKNLNTGQSKDFKGRRYTKASEGNLLIVTDI